MSGPSVPQTSLRVLAVVFALLFIATIWPVYPLSMLLSSARPFILGLPVSLVYVRGLSLVSFILLLAYELGTRRGNDR